MEKHGKHMDRRHKRSAPRRLGRLSKRVARWVWQWFRNHLLITVILVLVCLFMVMVYDLDYPSARSSAFIVAIISAVIGVVLTASVTSILLRSQAEHDEQKDVNIRVFTKKMEVYHAFLDHLDELIRNRELSDREIKQLFMRLSYVGLHARPKLMKEVYARMEELVEVLTGFRDAERLVGHDEGYYPRLSVAVSEVVRVLRTDLYGEEDDADAALDAFDALVARIDDVKVLPTVREQVTNMEATELVRTLHRRLRAALVPQLPDADQWEIRFVDGQNVDFRLRHRSWPGPEDYVGLMFDGLAASNLYFFVRFDGKGSRDNYRCMRSAWGGRFDELMWSMVVDDPYRNWRYDPSGLDAVRRCDDALVSYLAGQLARFAAYTYYFGLCASLSRRIDVKGFACRQWIYQNLCVVHEFDKDDLVIDTGIEGDGWTIRLFSRSGATETVREILRPKESDWTGYRVRYARIEGIGELASAAHYAEELVRKVDNYLKKTKKQR